MLENFIEWLDNDYFYYSIEGDDVYPAELEWSDSLAASASDYISQLSGCNIYVNNLVDDG